MWQLAWIKSHDELGEHPKTLRLAAELNVPIAYAVGLLHLLWHFTLRYSWRKGDLQTFGDAAIARASKWEGEPSIFIEALRKSRFLDGYKIHDWLDFSNGIVRHRIYNQRRAYKVRKNGVKGALERVEKSREEKNPLNPLSPSALSTPRNGTAAAKARTRELLSSTKSIPGHYDVPEDEIMGPEEFAKVKAAMGQKTITPELPEDPNDVF